MNEQTLSDLQKRRHTRALQIIKRWRLMDDDFMKRCLKNNIPAVECILRIIMEQPDLHVLSVTIEDTIPSLLGHGIRMDVHAVDSAGTEYDIEVQRSDKGAGARRARFNSSLLDLNSLKKGNTYDQLPESYVIFITENDIFKAGLARYHINRIIEELSRPFNDGEHIIYVNGDYHGSDQTSTRLAETSQQPAENDAAEQALFERAHKQAEHDDQRQLQGPVGLQVRQPCLQGPEFLQGPGLQVDVVRCLHQGRRQDHTVILRYDRGGCSAASCLMGPVANSAGSI